MKVELIPVIELVYNSPEIDTPNKYPYWEHPIIWYKYRNELLKVAGFEDEFEPYIKGYPFYEIEKISDKNLEKIVSESIGDWIEEDDDERNEVCGLHGGYILKVDGEDKYFPQCCGELSDIIYWEKLSNKKDSYYEGHPAPEYRFGFSNIVLDFSINKYGERFEPTPPEIKIKLSLKSLRIAIEKAKFELEKFSGRIKKINREKGLGVENLDKMLIWENPNHE